MSYKLLYVEDEPFLSRIVSDGLKASGYEVHLITDGKKALSAFETIQPDICVLDIMLPSKDGYTIAEEIRLLDHQVPIIFLSAKSLTEDVVKGFKTGGNDYLKKPFSMEELLVRIEALLYRFSGAPQQQPAGKETLYHFGTCTLDTVQQTLVTSSGKHTLSFKESALLEMLIRRKNDILERQEALLKIWNDDSYYNTRSMDVFMTHIRKLLKDEPGIQILSIRGVGYKLIC
ncbi:response regulator transcription factor [Chitinophaga pinensis]|uniref:Two component transcriptional regulator, winged helix family n=1 Tax=Chitinophaga pinensis (strain ATCC 43595 / DSM 2588 / LMG 13176 / NBRC 15968 / NCIMB 11800 / UQM 2034) TaxID=485918 RepID=A0A979G406_CHIPD|nr:response regulator transcription factor [Chitinophaga pinensis]ACU60221.1 two component transcriptional regulator, winged helix family [Chitinophaga pinensis DSM 2588]